MTHESAGIETCACCAGTSASTPQTIRNRPGLSEIAYRSGMHSDFLASMLAALSDQDRPALAGLLTRRPDDPTIALLDAFAVTCDVLTFYTERLANESFLRTASDRASLRELGKLVAYRLAPGVAAETHLAFALERPIAVPAAVSPDPGQLPPAVPESVTLHEGLRVQSVPGPDEKPQTFETVETISARPEWNALRVVNTRPYPPVKFRTDAWLKGAALNLEAGAAVLFASGDPGAADQLDRDHWDVRLLTGVETDNASDTTHIRWTVGLGSVVPPNQPASNPEAFVLRKRIAVFGHSAPQWKAMSKGFRQDYSGATDPPDKWPGFENPALHVIDDKTATIDLDGAHPDVVRGSWIVVSEEGDDFYRELFAVTGRAELSRSEYSVSGKITRLTLKGETGSHTFGSPRDVTVLAVSEKLTLAEAPDPSTVTGSSILVEGDATRMAEDRTLVVAGIDPSGEPQSEVVAVRSVTPQVGNRTRIDLAASLTGVYQRTGAVVFGNVARATHGETVEQILGSGDARQPFQTFPLRQSPLTFVPDDNPTGAKSTLQVMVDGLRWTERSSLYSAEAGERVYATRDEPDGSVSVVFGDGVRGARLSTGSSNVRATYRKGIGVAGNLRRDQLSQAMDRPLGLKGVTNPGPATGGQDSETEDTARTSIPRPVRTLGRAVSLQDYADFALAFPGIEKATATVLPLRAGRSIVVTVADSDGSPPASTTVGYLTDALRACGDPLARVVVLPVRTTTFEVQMKVKVDPLRDADTVLEAVEQALRDRWGWQSRAIGEPVYASALIAAAAGVIGVVGVDLDFLYRSGQPAAPNERLIAAAAGLTSAGEPVAAELLALSDAPLAKLEELA